MVVINPAMGAKYFGRQNPLGRQIQMTALKTSPEAVANPWFEIVGVVSDVKNQGVRACGSRSLPAIYGCSFWRILRFRPHGLVIPLRCPRH